MKPTALIIICSRPESSRVPRKVFRNIAGRPALSHIFERVRLAGFPVMLALPYRADMTNHDLMRYLELTPNEIGLYFGSSQSTLHRMAEAYQQFAQSTSEPPTYIVRVTHDDILIDHHEINAMVKTAAATGAGYAFCSSIMEGCGVEIIHAENLLEAARRNPTEKIEHVSYFVRGKGMPKPLALDIKPRPQIARPYRLTLDYLEDAVVLEAVLRGAGPSATNDSIAAWLDAHPAVAAYNQIPRVAVYTCAHNAEPWIAQTIESVLQNGAPHLIIDDASKDGTLAEILENRALSHRIIVNPDNLGLSSSCNLALKETRSRYVMRVDADDTLTPFALDMMVGKIRDTGAAIVYANYDEVDEGGKILTPNVSAKLHHHSGCALMDRRMIEEVRFTEGLKHWDSLDLFQRISGRFPVAYIEEPLWRYRQHTGSLSRSDLAERARVRADLEAREMGPERNGHEPRGA